MARVLRCSWCSTPSGLSNRSSPPPGLAEYIGQSTGAIPEIGWAMGDNKIKNTRIHYDMWKSESDMLVTWNKSAPHSSHHHFLLQRILGQRFQAARVKSELTATGRPTARDHRGCPARNSFRHRTRSEKVSRVGSRRLSSTNWTKINFSCWSISVSWTIKQICKPDTSQFLSVNKYLIFIFFLECQVTPNYCLLGPPVPHI